MRENIRKFDEAAGKAGCPILAVPLFLRQGWETTKASPVLVFAFAGCPILAVPLFLRQGWDTTKASLALVFAVALSTPLRPRQNVTKSVAKARKNTQVTTSQLKPNQQHTRNFPQKHPLPPFTRNSRHTFA